MEWFIQLQKKICEWEWYTDVPTKTLFFHILIKCNYKEAKWKWKTIKPWEFITSLEHLSLETWLTRQQVRTAIEKLKKTWEITHKATNDYTMLGLNNWETYNTQDNKRTTNEQQTNNKRITTTNKEYKDNKEYKENNTEIVATQPNEYLLSIDYLKNYSLETEIPDYAENYRDEWIKFCIYWGEKGKTWKIRAEWEKTFEIKKRFATWMSRKKEQYQQKNIPKESALDITL
mgnify:CR=1 FL=1